MKIMLKSLIRLILKLVYYKKDTVRILKGPAKGYRVAKSYALEYLGVIAGQYEADIIATYLSESDSVETVYDIGANVGYFSLLAGAQGKHVISFEPIPGNYQELENLVKINKLNTLIDCYQLALSNADGFTDMLAPAGDATWLIDAAIQGQSVDESRAVKVKTSTLDNIIKEKRLSVPGLIKIDVEGAEAMVLQGAEQVLSVYKPVLLIEVHGKKPAERVYDILQSYNYNINVIVNGSLLVVTEKKEFMGYFSESRWRIIHVLCRPGRDDD